MLDTEGLDIELNMILFTVVASCVPITTVTQAYSLFVHLYLHYDFLSKCDVIES